jgi:hypothetical protein
MSMPFDHNESTRTGEHQLRSLLVNKLSAARRLGDFVRGLWSSVEIPEPPPEAGCEIPADSTVAPDAVFSPEPLALESEPEGLPEPAAEPARPARFDLRVLWAPKGGNDEREWEDGYAANAGAGVVALADGAGDGIFSKLWADLLLESFVAQPIALDDAAAVEPWIQAQRRAWLQAIRYPEQRWSIQMKIDRSCGAATFVALKLDPVEAAGNGPGQAIGWTAWAVGDACLFHVRGGNLTGSFPAAAASEFGTTPYLYQSKPLRATPVAVVTRGELGPDDLIVFATDAVAQRLLMEVESGAPPDWRRFWDLDQETWRQEIAELRAQNAIVNDDCTLLVIRLPVPSPEAAENSDIEQDQGILCETPEEIAPAEVDTPYAQEQTGSIGQECGQASVSESNEWPASMRSDDATCERPSSRSDDHD